MLDTELTDLGFSDGRGCIYDTDFIVSHWVDVLRLASHDVLFAHVELHTTIFLHILVQLPLLVCCGQQGRVAVRILRSCICRIGFFWLILNELIDFLLQVHLNTFKIWMSQCLICRNSFSGLLLEHHSKQIKYILAMLLVLFAAEVNVGRSILR